MATGADFTFSKDLLGRGTGLGISAAFTAFLFKSHLRKSSVLI
jgi:hypothetical protein